MKTSVAVVTMVLLLMTAHRLPAPIQELSPPPTPQKSAKRPTQNSAGSHWADLEDRNVIGEWQSCGSSGCTSTNIKPDRTFIFTNLSNGKVGYSGDWHTSGNMLLLHITSTGTAPASVKGQTIPFIVTDLSPNKMYTRFPNGDTSKHLWTRRK